MRVVPICQRGPSSPTVDHIQVKALVVGLAVAELTLRMAVRLTPRTGTGLSILAAARLVFVVRIVLLMLLPQPLSLFNKWSLVTLIKKPIKNKMLASNTYDEQLIPVRRKCIYFLPEFMP